jgi:phosphoadenosine phosphosulfate reductase
MSEVLNLRPATRVPHLDPPAPPIVTRTTGKTDRRETASLLAVEFDSLDLFERVALLRRRVPGRIVFTTGFGVEGQAIAHAIFSQALDIEVVTLDTGRLFPETFDVWAATERRYATRIVAIAPNDNDLKTLVARQGVDGFRETVGARLECCAVRKVAPLARALNGADAWIAGIRADQSPTRAHLGAVSFDKQRALIKAHPLFDWTRDQVLAFVRMHDVPYNALHDRGFPSVGCAPCTRAVAPGEPERAGRWWWEHAQHKECGLHLTSNGRFARASGADLTFATHQSANS